MSKKMNLGKTNLLNYFPQFSAKYIISRHSNNFSNSTFSLKVHVSCLFRCIGSYRFLSSSSSCRNLELRTCPARLELPVFRRPQETVRGFVPIEEKRCPGGGLRISYVPFPFLTLFTRQLFQAWTQAIIDFGCNMLDLLVSRLYFRIDFALRSHSSMVASFSRRVSLEWM